MSSVLTIVETGRKSAALAVIGRGKVFSKASRTRVPVDDEVKVAPAFGKCIALRKPIPVNITYCVTSYRVLTVADADLH
jgi:hypothetical protein